MLKNKLTFIALSTLSFTATSFLVINTPASASVRSTIPASLRGTWYGSTDAGVYKYTFTKTTLSEELGLPTNNYKFKKQKASIAGRITYRIGYQKNRLSINSQKDRKGFWRFKLSSKDYSTPVKFKLIKYHGRHLINQENNLYFARTVRSSILNVPSIPYNY